MSDSERKDDARAKNHEHFRGQDALPPFVLCIADPVQFLQRFLSLLVNSPSMPDHFYIRPGLQVSPQQAVAVSSYFASNATSDRSGSADPA